MAAGLTVYNNDYKIQIDSAYKNLHLSRKITLSKAGTTSGTFADGECLAVVGGTTHQSINAVCINSPTGWTCTVKTFRSGMCVYVFTTKATASTHGVGLQVFDENGAIVYDSNDKHPIVCGFGNKDGVPFRAAAKPAMAVCQNRRVDYNQDYMETVIEWEQESSQVYHEAEYETVTEQYQTYEYVPDQYEWVAGHYESRYVAGHYESQYVAGYYDWQFVNGSYQQVYVPGGYQQVYVPGGYQQVWVEGHRELVTPAHTEIVWKTRQVQKQKWPAYWETVYTDVPYLCQYRTIYYRFTETNFILSSGNVAGSTISEGTTGHSTRDLVSKRSISGSGRNDQYWGSNYYPTSIVVDTRSWLLFDVNGL